MATKISLGAGFLCLSFMVSGALTAGEVEILGAQATAQGNDEFRFSVTLRHGDTGWDHYADAWRVETEGGDILGTRTLFHPHEDEQPFTRSLNGVSIAGDTKTVFIRAHDSVHGWTEETVAVPLR
ncbi:MAG: hypothetical protein ACPGO3_10030 [Magnetospiraceae bacterium]